jgi:hypothetical protein
LYAVNDRSLSSQSALLLPAAATSRDANVEDVVLRESLHSRCRQARPAFFATVLNTAVVVPFIGRGLQLRWIAAWLAVLLVLLLIRYRT